MSNGKARQGKTFMYGGIIWFIVSIIGLNDCLGAPKTVTLTPVSTSTAMRFPPRIVFTEVPPYGSFEDIHGLVEYADPAAYKVVVYIYVAAWWTKPYLHAPLTDIQSDGTWTTDITTGGVDEQATIIAAFLVPSGYSPPILEGSSTLPREIFANSIHHAHRERTRRVLAFSGYDWNVKFSDGRVGPGPNYFSDATEDVWVDKDGRLHLTITSNNGRWYATEVFTQTPLGYGKYSFHIASRVKQLDKHVVLGLFTWDSVSPVEHHNREIDIEFSRWGDEQADNSQYVVQPWDKVGHRNRFQVELGEIGSTHCFDWEPNAIRFSSYRGRGPAVAVNNQIQSWVYLGSDIPPVGNGNARINLWLINGDSPSDGQEVEVILEAFEFIPMPEPNN